MTDWQACDRRLAQGMEALEQPASTAVRRQLLAYLQELVTWNATHNLTAVRAPEAMVTRHLLDCLAVTDLVCGPRLGDIGSGPGLPGIVLAISQPQLDVTLVESNRKKATFLRHVRRRLALDNIEVVQKRVADWQPPCPLDCLITRAFASAAETARDTAHLLVGGGRLLLMKGRDPAEELQALPPGFCPLETRVIQVPGLEAQRHVAILARSD